MTRSELEAMAEDGVCCDAPAPGVCHVRVWPAGIHWHCIQLWVMPGWWAGPQALGIETLVPPAPSSWHPQPQETRFFLLLLRSTPAALEVSGLGVEVKLHLQPMLQLQQHQFQVASATYTAACSNAGSLTH